MTIGGKAYVDELEEEVVTLQATVNYQQAEINELQNTVEYWKQEYYRAEDRNKELFEELKERERDFVEATHEANCRRSYEDRPY